MNTETVECCIECPLIRDDRNGDDYCGHPELYKDGSGLSPDKYIEDVNVIPSWCPLIRHQLTIQIIDNQQIKTNL